MNLPGTERALKWQRAREMGISKRGRKRKSERASSRRALRLFKHKALLSQIALIMSDMTN